MQLPATISDSLQELIGKRAWGLKRTHGSMFFLEFGEAVDRGVTSRGHRRVHGEWHFLFESCSWDFYSATSSIVNSSDQTVEIESRFDALSLGWVQDSTFDMESGRLDLIFTSNVSLIVEPSNDTDLEPDDLEWLFFVPGELAWRKAVNSLELGDIHTAG